MRWNSAIFTSSLMSCVCGCVSVVFVYVYVCMCMYVRVCRRVRERVDEFLYVTVHDIE